VEASRKTGVDEQLRAILAIESEVLLEHLASPLPD
jgi:hypothetical protein